MLDIKEKLKVNADLVEHALEQCYDYTNADFQQLIEAQRYGLLGGGKRIRAFLVLEMCRLFSGDIAPALPYACAIEMIHASSLIHDDMPCMDDDDTRRGKPSTHKKYGEALALLSGDAMMVKAFEITVKNSNLSSQENAKAVEILAESTGDCGMLAGQTMDIKAASEKLDFETLIRLHKLKTGKLISASAKLGCLAAGIEEYDERCVSAIKYAENVGLAFQIIDDILDYNEGKRELNSFLSFMSVEEATKYALDLTGSGIDAISPYDDGTFTELAKYLIKREY